MFPTVHGVRAPRCLSLGSLTAVVIFEACEVASVQWVGSTPSTQLLPGTRFPSVAEMDTHSSPPLQVAGMAKVQDENGR